MTIASRPYLVARHLLSRMIQDGWLGSRYPRSSWESKRCTRLWDSAATIPTSCRVGTPSNILISTVPKSGCGRTSHHTSLMLRMVPARSSVSMYSSNSLQSASKCGGPAVGNPPKMTALLDASPVSCPPQNGLDAVSARKCGR